MTLVSATLRVLGRDRVQHRLRGRSMSPCRSSTLRTSPRCSLGHRVVPLWWNRWCGSPRGWVAAGPPLPGAGEDPTSGGWVAPVAVATVAEFRPGRGRGAPMVERGLAVAAATAAAVLLAPAAAALADPPQALPANHTEAEGKWQPAFDYDKDGCYPTPAIGPDGTLNAGLHNSGALNGQCRDSRDLD